VCGLHSNYAPLIHSRRMALYKRVLINWLFDWLTAIRRAKTQEPNRRLNSDEKLTSEIWVIFSTQRIIRPLRSILVILLCSISQWSIIRCRRRDKWTSMQHQLAIEFRFRYDTNACCYSFDRVKMLQLGQQHCQSFFGDLTATGESNLIQQSYNVAVAVSTVIVTKNFTPLLHSLQLTCQWF